MSNVKCEINVKCQISEDNIPCTKSFLFLMSNDLLPNNEFLFKISKVESPMCSFCDSRDGRLHFLICPFSDGLGVAVIEIVAEAATVARR